MWRRANSLGSWCRAAMLAALSRPVSPPVPAPCYGSAVAGNSNKKKSALAQAASRRLERIGPPRMTPEQIAHFLLHAEERGEVQRVQLENGGIGWAMQGPDGQRQILPATAEILAAFERFEREGHPPHE